MSQLRIFIADPNRNGRLAMQMLLDHEPGMKVVGIAVQLEGLVEQVTAVQPDVALIDWNFVVSAPKTLISNLRAMTAQLQIVILDVREETKQDAESSGANRFVSKDSPPDKLLTIMQEIKQNKE